MNQYTVVANKGWESGKMTALDAYRYARTLRKLGNVAVWVRVPR